MKDYDYKPVAPVRLMSARIENDFSYHPPKPGQPAKYEAIRAKAKELAELIAELTTPGREQSAALTNLDQVVFFANASIARNE